MIIIITAIIHGVQPILYAYICIICKCSCIHVLDID